MSDIRFQNDTECPEYRTNTPEARKMKAEKRCYTVDELRDFLGIGRIAVYELLKRNEFHWVKIGGRYLISKASFDAWLDGNS